MTSPDDHLEQRARALFHRAGRELDPAMAGRLRAARRDATRPPSATRRAARLLLPAGAFAVAALAALTVWQPHRADPGAVPPGVMANASDDGDLPPDADSADPSLYQNLDFYGWLAANDAGAKASH